MSAKKSKPEMTFIITIDGGEDFMINGESSFVKEITIDKNLKTRDKVFSIIKGLKFTACKNKEGELAELIRLSKTGSEFYHLFNNLMMKEEAFDHTNYLCVGDKSKISIKTR